MKLTILGCGTSTGVPIPGCTCEVCTSGDPKNERMRTSALITTDSGENILIDASPDLHQQALRFKINRLEAVLYTHAHADHILGTDDLRVYNFSRNAPLPCYGDSETLTQLKDFFRYIFEPNPNYEGGLLAKLELNEIEPYSTFSVAEIPITPFALSHGSSPVTGYKFGDIAYATDCNYLPPETEELLRNVPVLILDGLRYKAHKTHFTIDQAVAKAQELGAKRTYLIHMTHDVDYHSVNKALPAGIELAYDGLEIKL